MKRKIKLVLSVAVILVISTIEDVCVMYLFYKDSFDKTF